MVEMFNLFEKRIGLRTFHFIMADDKGETGRIIDFVEGTVTISRYSQAEDIAEAIKIIGRREMPSLHNCPIRSLGHG